MLNCKREDQTGCGIVGKALVARAKHRETERVWHASQTDASTLQNFVREHATPGRLLDTDGARAASGKPEFTHGAVNHHANGPVHEAAPMDGMDPFRTARGRDSPKPECRTMRLVGYVGVLSGRLNLRDRDMRKQTGSIVARTVGHRLRHRHPIAGRRASGARPAA